MAIPQTDIRLTDNWMLLLEWIGSKDAEFVGNVEIEGFTQSTYPAYKAANNPNSPLVAYIH